jgi:Trypsin-like peptidase domain
VGHQHMAAQAAGRHALSLLLGLAIAGTAGIACAQDTTFFSGAELAARLRQNLVWIAAQDIGEHGYGMVVGGDNTTVWVITARHVVVKTAMRGSTTPDEPSHQIRMRFCAAAATGLVPGEPWPGWDTGGEDIALLSVARPRDYQWATRALAPQVTVGEPVWLLGSNDECALVPAQGQVRALADSANNLRIDFTGVQGGSSGAPVLSGHGVLGLMKSAEDLTTTVHAIADLQRRVQALGGVRWELVDARNIPPTDPRAAEVDLAETLNQYLLAVRNVHMALQQRQVARPTLDDFVQRYNVALRRFLRVRDAYDGSLNRYWPPPVLPAWQGLREKLWAVHQNFWRIDPLMAEIYKNQRTSADVRTLMAALEPDLVRLEGEIAQFLRLIAKEH